MKMRRAHAAAFDAQTRLCEVHCRAGRAAIECDMTGAGRSGPTRQ
jgi:hypothetical protein